MPSFTFPLILCITHWTGISLDFPTEEISLGKSNLVIWSALSKHKGCEVIILSRLFKTNYAGKEDFYGPIKFNLINKKYTINLIPLGGIKNSNLLKLNLINSNSFAIFSEIKKKPAIANRLF